MLPRKLSLADKTKAKTSFLFGPRGVGKTTLIRDTYSSDVLKIDLLKSRFYKQFFIISEDPVSRTIKDSNHCTLQIIPWKEFLAKIWNGDIEL